AVRLGRGWRGCCPRRCRSSRRLRGIRCRLQTMLAYRSFARPQLAAASRDHVALRQIDLSRVGEGFVANWVLAGFLLNGSRQTEVDIHRSEAVSAMPLP